MPDRTAVVSALESTLLFHVIGAPPAKAISYPGSPHITTAGLAERCALFILLLGGRYGDDTVPGISPTEIEFEAAYKTDPTKILVFRKERVKLERKQVLFIKRLEHYDMGYWRTSYRITSELRCLVLNSVLSWMKDRAQLGHQLNYFDHFVRIAKQRIPAPTAEVFYTVDQDHIELKYRMFARTFVVHFDKASVYADFWGSLASLEKSFQNWRRLQ